MVVQEVASVHAWSSSHGIITDRDRAMQNTIQIIFPNTKHKWCLWYILKFFEILGTTSIGFRYFLIYMDWSMIPNSLKTLKKVGSR